MRVDLGNSGQADAFLEVRDVRTIDDASERSQLISDLEAFARDPQRKTMEAVLDAVGVTNSSQSLRHPRSRTGDLRDSYGKANTGHLPDGVYGQLLDSVKQRAPQWLSQIRAQAAEAAKVARSTAQALASQPEAERIFLGKAIVLEQEADRAHRAFITARAALGWRQRRGTVGEALMEQSRVEARAARHAALTKAARDARDAPATRRWRRDATGGTYELNADGTLAGTDGLLPAPAFLEKAAGGAGGAAANGLLAQAAEYRQLASTPGGCRRPTWRRCCRPPTRLSGRPEGRRSRGPARERSDRAGPRAGRPAPTTRPPGRQGGTRRQVARPAVAAPRRRGVLVLGSGRPRRADDAGPRPRPPGRRGAGLRAGRPRRRPADRPCRRRGARARQRGGLMAAPRLHPQIDLDRPGGRERFLAYLEQEGDRISREFDELLAWWWQTRVAVVVAWIRAETGDEDLAALLTERTAAESRQATAMPAVVDSLRRPRPRQ
jgi:hypothetical protein